MITKVVHGWKVGGLITYLMGPGRAQEHLRPRVIASWDGRDGAWHPASDGRDRDLGPLIRALRAPVFAAGLPERAVDGKRGYVWHLSARVASADRVLSDTEWADVARELLNDAGVAARGDAGGPRWVAIRHADDHIHVAVVLVRQDTARRIWPNRDYPRLREAARRIEARLGITVTAAADGTAARAPSRGEIEKAQRRGVEPARSELARAVREAAVSADGPDAFVAALDSGGYLVQVRRGPSGDLLGYKVARGTDVDASGAPVFYSGSKLAPDLSLPRLIRTWARSGPEVRPLRSLDTARIGVDRARASVAAARGRSERVDTDDVVHATRDVLTAVGTWSSTFQLAADQFDRAARSPRGCQPRHRVSAVELRRVARQLVRCRWLLGDPDDPTAGAVALAVSLTALVREIALLQRDRGRAHQAVAAQESAKVITRWIRVQVKEGGDQRLDHAAAAVEPHDSRSARPGLVSRRG